MASSATHLFRIEDNYTLYANQSLVRYQNQVTQYIWGKEKDPGTVVWSQTGEQVLGFVVSDDDLTLALFTKHSYAVLTRNNGDSPFGLRWERLGAVNRLSLAPDGILMARTFRDLSGAFAVEVIRTDADANGFIVSMPEVDPYQFGNDNMAWKDDYLLLAAARTCGSERCIGIYEVKLNSTLLLVERAAINFRGAFEPISDDTFVIGTPQGLVTFSTIQMKSSPSPTFVLGLISLAFAFGVRQRRITSEMRS
jgi:hypothetical protein